MTNENKIEVATQGAIQNIPIGQIVPDPKNRKEHDAEALALLAESIKVDGLLQPILVRVVETEPTSQGPKASKFMIIAGERRWRAHQLAKLPVVACRVIADQSELEATRKRAAENLHRLDLTPVEEAQQFQDLIDTGMTQAAVASFVGSSQPAVANQLRLLQLPPSVRKLIHEGVLSRAHGVALARFSRWPKVVAKMAECAVEEETSAKEIERDELPFEWQLRSSKLIVELSCYEGYTATEALKKDPDWLCFSGSLYCFDPAKGEAEKVRQDAERAKKVESEKGRAKSAAAGGSKMSPAEKAARERTIAANKQKRAEMVASLIQGTAKVKASQDDAAKVLLHEAFDWKYASHVGKAAESLGIKLPDTLKRAQTGPGGNLSAERLLEAVGLPTALKLAAQAIMLKVTEQCLKSGYGVPDVVKIVAGKVKVAAPVAAQNPEAKGKETGVRSQEAGGQKPETRGQKTGPGSQKPAGKRVKRVRITDEVRSKVKALVLQGKTGAEVAKAVGLSLPAVQTIKKSFGLVKSWKGAAK